MDQLENSLFAPNVCFWCLQTNCTTTTCYPPDDPEFHAENTHLFQSTLLPFVQNAKLGLAVPLGRCLWSLCGTESFNWISIWLRSESLWKPWWLQYRDSLHQDTLIYENHDVGDTTVDEGTFEDDLQWRVSAEEMSDPQIDETQLYVSEEWLISPGTKEISRANFNIRFRNDKSKFINCIKEVKLDSCGSVSLAHSKYLTNVKLWTDYFDIMGIIGNSL